jgi:diaminopimelate decarboxylase
MTNYTQIDNCLSTRNGHLFIEDCDTVELVKRFKSPLFVISENQLRQNVRTFREAFAPHWPSGDVEVLPAIKANWILATRKILSEEGAGADIYSYGELHAALEANVNPEIISVNGGGKQEDLIEKCVRMGVRITVEDLDEPELINHVAARLGRKAKIRFRVKPNFPELYKPTDFAQEKVSIDIGLQVYKSGIPAQYLPDLGIKVLQMSNIDLVGLHFHGGRHNPSLWYWRKLMKSYANLIAELCRTWGDWQPQEIDIGGGFAIYRDPHNKLGLRQDVVETWMTWPLVQLMRLLKPCLRYRIMGKVLSLFTKTPNRNMAPTIEEYGQAAAGTLHKELNHLGINTQGVKLQIEPGRCLYGNTGIHLTRVKKFKQQTIPMAWNWVLTDTTYFFLTGGMYEYQLNHFIFANRTDDKPKHVADIVGHSCYADRILPIVQVPDVKIGDLIAILDMGAYQEVSACNFNALPRPATLLVNGSHAEIIRRAETIEDVFRRDVVPERLKGAKTEVA